MYELKDKKIAVIGLDQAGLAAAKLCSEAGARVTRLEANGTSSSQKKAAVRKNETVIADRELGKVDLVVHSPQVSRQNPTLTSYAEAGTEVISDLELAASRAFCLNIAITGSNGKTTTAELIAEMLAVSQRKTIRAGASGAPVCEIIEQSRELDFLTLDVNAFQLSSIQYFRPAVAILTNIRPDNMKVFGSMAEYARTLGRIFKNQQVFDWAIVQSEALAHLRTIGVEIPSKLITFSAKNRRADIYLDRGLLISSLPNWSGPLFNMEQCALPGPHNAENVMAALAAGRVLRLKLEEMVAALKAYRPGPHRLEPVTERGGVKFINNSKALNLHALEQSIEALNPAPAGEPNIWLIAGGRDQGLDYHDLGPLLARRVKGAFLLGEAREKLRAAWSLFTPCTMVETLLEAVSKAAENAVAGDIVLLSPACSSLDMFQSYHQRGDVFKQAVMELTNQKTQNSRTKAAA